MGYRRDCTHQPLWVDRTLLIKMLTPEEPIIYLCKNVGRILRITVTKPQKETIANEQESHDMEDVAMIDGERQHRYDAIAERDTL